MRTLLTTLTILIHSAAQAEDYQHYAQNLGFFSWQARSYYRMARVMTYVKDLVKASNRAECAEEFTAFYQRLRRENLWQESEEKLKAFLLDLSHSGKLESLPTQKHLRFYLRYPIEAWCTSEGLSNDPFKIIALYLSHPKLAATIPHAALFAKVDLCLSTHGLFKPFPDYARRFATPAALLERIYAKAWFNPEGTDLTEVKHIALQYQPWFYQPLHLEQLAPAQASKLLFEAALYRYLTQKLGIQLVRSGHPFEGEPASCPICTETMRGSTAECSSCHNQLCLACLYRYREVNTEACCPFCRAALGENLSNFTIAYLPLPSLLEKAYTASIPVLPTQ